MNAKHLIAAAVVFAATGSAFAQQTEYVSPAAGFVSSKSRADVIAERDQAYTEGTLALAQRDGQNTVVATGNRSRADVRAEATQNNKGSFVKSLYFGA